MHKSQRARRLSQQAGFTLLEVMIALAVMAIAVAKFAPQLIRHADDMTDVVVADHQRLAGEKAREYIKDNYNAVLAAAAPGAPAIITIQMLKNSGYWPVGMEERNAYGQVPRAVVRKTAANRLETAIITSGGEKIPERSLRSIAAQAGLAGGFVSDEAPTVMQGARGSWSFPLSDYGVSSGGGVLASSLVFQDGAVVDDYLYRNAVPNRPDLNEMNTALGMRGNDINNVGQAFARRVETTQDVRVGQTLAVGADAVVGGSATVNANVTVAGETTTGGWFRNTGDSGWYNQKWGGGFHMSDPTWIRATNDKNIYTGGEVLASRVSAAGRLRAGEYLQLDATANEGWGCSPNGLVGRTTEGLILSCQSGVWRAPTASLVTVPGTSCPSGLTPIMYYGSVYNVYSGRGPTGWFSVGDMTDYSYACSAGGGDAGGTCDGRYNVNVPERASISMVKCG